MSYIDLLADREDLVSPGISACQGCMAELSLRTVLKILGRNTVVGIPPGCMAGAGCVGWNYENGLKIPVHIPLLDNTASLLAGVKRMYERQGRDVHVLAFAGDGASADCGFQSLSGAAERGDTIIYVCYDNEGYMNTGFQRSSTTTKGSATSTTPSGRVRQGKEQHQKDMPLLMAMHKAAYVATLSPAYMADFTRKVQKAMEVKHGLSYLHIFSPCPTGWGFEPALSVTVARKAVQTNFFPLFEYENQEYRVNVLNKNPQSLTALFGMLKKFSHLGADQLDDIKRQVERKYQMLLALANLPPL